MEPQPILDPVMAYQTIIVKDVNVKQVITNNLEFCS